MTTPNESTEHHKPHQEKTLEEKFSKKQQTVLRERLSQDAFRHFEDALHGKRTATESEVAEWTRVSGT